MKIGSIASQAIANAAPPQDAEPIQETPTKPIQTGGQDGLVRTGASLALAANVVIEPAPTLIEERANNSRPNRPYPSPTFTPNTR